MGEREIFRLGTLQSSIPPPDCLHHSIIEPEWLGPKLGGLGISRWTLCQTTCCSAALRIWIRRSGACGIQGLAGSGSLRWPAFHLPAAAAGCMAFPHPPAAASNKPRSAGANFGTLARLLTPLFSLFCANCLHACRLGLVARVSRRFRSLCLAPELLHRVDFTAKGEAENAVRRLHAFLAFLLEHAQHVRVIHLNANLDLLPARERDAAAALVASCLLASNRLADALEHLTIHPNTPLITTAWLPGLTALTKLTMGSVAEKLNLPPDFSQLRALASAELAGRPLGVDEGARLPPGLTRLRLRVSHSAHIMHQVRMLRQLYCTSGVPGLACCAQAVLVPTSSHQLHFLLLFAGACGPPTSTKFCPPGRSVKQASLASYHASPRLSRCCRCRS